ncbi:VolA/Pla-1 family phospholipase [Pseudoalteromonas phenolica]|uniref:VolA/Pla-1 family phospholipase n=1 Tax=Pseudoalteromonas phenolica TaxID=161398 RepID=UPI00110AB782|nr:VolA/Pla-1 family phospholipase [Pseudoalteromonas phenolica]TMO54219.1 lipase [Pseudoalteromonas phenolica]
MKKMLLSLAISTALVGCGGGETLQDVKQETTPVLPSASIKFDPSNGVISIPNDLLLSGTKDGTLNLPGEFDDQGQPLAAAAYANPSLTMGGLDGWSTNMPYVIDLDVPSEVSINADSVATPDAVRIFEVVMGASITDPDCASDKVPAGIACKYVGELTFGVDYIAKLTDSGNGIMVVPLKPLKPGTSYITALTKSIVMADGRPLEASSTYSLVKAEAPLVTDSQRSLQVVVNKYEEVISGQVAKEDIIYTAAMTIQSVGAVMNNIKLGLAQSLQTQTNPRVSVPEQPMITVSDALATVIPDAETRAPFQAVQYMQGSIMLPMYSKKPEGTAIEDLAGTYWKARCDSAATLAGAVAAGVDLSGLTPGANDAYCNAASGGVLRDFGLDQSRFLTKFNSIPSIEWIANVPVQITKPRAELLGIEMPATGWPVVILQHGITANKESLLGLTLALSNAGFATVAIDHPMHGARGLDIDLDGKDDFNATSGQGSVLSYMNLTSLLVARDNLRQSSADLLALRLGLNFIDPTLGINPTDVSFFGHSLGSIVAPNFIANTNKSIGNETVDNLFKVNTVGLASGGAGIANFLTESGSFGSFVKGSVLAAAGNLSSKAFLEFVASEATAACPVETKIPCSYALYEKQLVEAGNTAALGSIQSIISQFVTVAQTTLDSADPVNYASAVQALGTPTYLSVVTGGVDGNQSDAVIPPTTALPLSGTMPMAQLLGMTPVTETQQGEPKNYVVKFSQGHHSSIATTSFNESVGGTAQGHAMTTVEMQTQLAAFLKSKGMMLPISNPAVIAN